MPTLQRFSPQEASLEQAYDRATRTPRDVAQLAATLVAWELSNLARDCLSPTGDLPHRFGFEPGDTSRAPIVDAPYSLAIAAAARLYVTDRRLVIVHDSGSVVLAMGPFDPLHAARPADSSAEQLPTKGQRAVTPRQWVIGWACMARTFALFARYERWVLATAGHRYRYDGETQRPKAARRCAVPLLQLPDALDSVGEWCSDSETAMLTYIIADARRRGIEPDIPRL